MRLTRTSSPDGSRSHQLPACQLAAEVYHHITGKLLWLCMAQLHAHLGAHKTSDHHNISYHLSMVDAATQDIQTILERQEHKSECIWMHRCLK